ncbi:MAG: hypothetical protein K0S23_531 [Fluviicola sp.]|jgi:hypothetical protein|uniref:hypothetical protein n=1 Tax=Fluviicola sp. TaxID=1917219 RepID=UPI0026070BE3|nr:hypothetical protein [Fluviicola sp.]MDF3026224.1 hypothetical protein [Fluviicola sp.]
MSEFIAYEKFATIPELKEFVELLKSNNIPYELEDDVEIFDVSFANNNHHRDYRIKLYPEDFDRVNELRNAIAGSELDQVDPGYYLFDFTDEELIDLISKQDEWSPFDFQLAQKILKDRGNEVTPQKINQLKEQRLEELSEPEKHDTFWIGLGYVFAFLGGLIGIIIGYYIISSKKTLPNGERVFTYTEADRKHGSRILLIAITAIILAIAFRIIN